MASVYLHPAHRPFLLPPPTHPVPPQQLLLTFGLGCVDQPGGAVLMSVVPVVTSEACRITQSTAWVFLVWGPSVVARSPVECGLCSRRPSLRQGMRESILGTLREELGVQNAGLVPKRGQQLSWGKTRGSKEDRPMD